MFVLSDRIVATLAPRVAPCQPAYGHPSSFQGTIFPKGFDGVLGTSWSKTTLVPDPRTEQELIAFNELDQEPGHFVLALIFLESSNRHS